MSPAKLSHSRLCTFSSMNSKEGDHRDRLNRVQVKHDLLMDFLFVCNYPVQMHERSNVCVCILKNTQCLKMIWFMMIEGCEISKKW